MDRSACRHRNFPCVECNDEAFRRCYASMIEELEQFMAEVKKELDLLKRTTSK